MTNISRTEGFISLRQGEGVYPKFPDIYTHFINLLPEIKDTHMLVTERKIPIDVLRKNNIKAIDKDYTKELHAFIKKSIELENPLDNIPSILLEMSGLKGICKGYSYDVVFPFYNGDKVEYIQGLHKETRARHNLGNVKKAFLYIPKQIQDNSQDIKDVYIGEGVIDALSFLSLPNKMNGVAIIDSGVTTIDSNVNKDNLEELERLKSFNCWLVGDNDTTGIKAVTTMYGYMKRKKFNVAYDSVERIAKEEYNITDKAFKDINDLLRETPIAKENIKRTSIEEGDRVNIKELEIEAFKKEFKKSIEDLSEKDKKFLIKQLEIEKNNLFKEKSKLDKDKSKLDKIKKIMTSIEYKKLDDAIDILKGKESNQVVEETLKFDDFLTAINKDESEGLKTGIPCLDDKKITIPNGQLSFIAARTGEGKTTVLINCITSWLEAYPEKTFIFISLEVPKETIFVNLISNIKKGILDYNNNNRAVKEYLKTNKLEIEQDENKNKEHIDEGIEKIKEYIDNKRLILFENLSDIDSITKKITEINKSHKLGGVCLDYLQIIKNEQKQTKQLEIADTLSKLLRCARDNKAPIFSAVQLGRPNKDKKDKSNIVTLDNLRESGDIEQYANVVIGLATDGDQSEEGDQDCSFKVLKNRSGATTPFIEAIIQRPNSTIREKISIGKKDAINKQNNYQKDKTNKKPTFMPRCS